MPASSPRSRAVAVLAVLAAVAGGMGLLPDAAAARLARRPAATDRPASATADSLPLAAPNDNRAPAGRLRDGVLAIDLTVRRARWQPEGDRRATVEVEAVSEAGKAPTVPGPLVRVPAGTVIEATVRNTLPDSAVHVFGLHARPSAPDSFRLAPGEVRRVRFEAGAPGTYLYRFEMAGADRPYFERETASGAFVVDPPGRRPDDRVLVMNIWGSGTDSTPYRNALTINGRSWPHGERLEATTGDSIRWRVVNASSRGHPMHLHGFYFRVDGTGLASRYTALEGDARRLVVTEPMPDFSTMDIVWSPDRPGNWLFHCHLAQHVVPETAVLDRSPAASEHALSHDADEHMVGLILGVHVAPARGWREPPRTKVHTMHLYVNQGASRRAGARALSYVLQDGARPPAPDSLVPGSSVLVVTRDQPTDIVVHNRLKEPTAVHWHGIELESWSDGVAGWSGARDRTAPAIAPGDSFVARLSLPRAGTFMYHTHLGDLLQLTSGLFGAMIVLEPGERWDPATDHVFVGGWDGRGGARSIVVNGTKEPPPLEIAAGRAHRLRLVGIAPAPPMAFVLRRDTTVSQWRALAKDGADLPPSQATPRPSIQGVGVGQTFDFEFTPEPGEYRLAVEVRAGGQPIVPWKQRIIVK